MLRSLAAAVASRRRRAIVAVGLAGVMAATGGWILGWDESETKVAAGSNDALPALPDTTMSLFPGEESGGADPTSTTTTPAASKSSGPSGVSRPVPPSSPTTTATGPGIPAVETTTSSMTPPTAPPSTVTTVPLLDPNCGAPLGPAFEPGPKATGWRTIPAAPIAARMRHGSVWTGREMIVWGGSNGDDNASKEFNDGAAYDPATGTWRVLPAAPLKGRTMPALVWTGKEVVLFGGGPADAAAYDPAKNCWRTIADYPLGYSSTGFGAVATTWAGGRVLVWNSTTEGAAWDPIADDWERFAGPANAGSCPRFGRWAGDRLFVWWSPDSACGSNKPVTAAVYDPSTQQWTSVAIPGDVQLSLHAGPAVWTGQELILPGLTSGEPQYTTWFAFEPGTGRWRTLPQPSYFEPSQTATWTGAEMILWGGMPGGPSHTYAYDPVKDQWREAGRSPFDGRYGHTAVWTGTEMIVWGGQGDGKLTWSDGGAYRPA